MVQEEKPRLPQVYRPETKPHKFCPGCGHPIVLKMLGQVIDEMKLAEKVIFLVDIGCSLLAWDFFNLPTSQTHHGRTVPVAIGAKLADPEKIVVAYVGDGGAYAIGLQHTVTSCLRNDPITTIVVNNTLYAMTGGQMAPTTMVGETTTTSPSGKKVAVSQTLFGPEMLAKVATPEAYLARGTTEKPLVLKQYLKKALETQIKGQYSLVEALSACPLNWRTNAPDTIATMKKMATTFPLGEVKR